MIDGDFPRPVSGCSWLLCETGGRDGKSTVRVAPTESQQGAREKYTIRVPNEEQVKCVRIEGEFPADVNVYDFEFKPGWKIDFKKDDKGKIVGAVWTGTMMPYEFVEFGMLGLNSKTGASLVWKFVQGKVRTVRTGADRSEC